MREPAQLDLRMWERGTKDISERKKDIRHHGRGLLSYQFTQVDRIVVKGLKPFLDYWGFFGSPFPDLKVGAICHVLQDVVVVGD